MNYSLLLKAPSIRVWAVITLGTRLAVTTVPLGAVLFAASTLDSYSIGGLLAGGYAAGEAVLAPVMGRRIQRHPLRREIAGAVAAEAVLLLAAVLLVLETPAQWWCAVAAMTLAGGIASGVPGALRSHVSHLGGDSAGRDRALALDTMLNQGCWLSGPALAAATATAIAPAAPLLIVAAVLLLTLAVVPLLGSHCDATEDAPHESLHTGALIRAMIVPIAASALIMTMMAALDVMLPALLADHGAPSVLAGVTLAALAAASIACSAVYGGKQWPGTARTHSLAAIAAMSGLMAVTGLVPGVIAALVTIVAIGIAEAPALLGRSIALTAELSPAQWPVGFSLLYSAGGVGYTVGSVLSGGLVEQLGARTGFVTVGVVSATAIAVIAAVERHSQHHDHPVREYDTAAT